MVGWLHKQQIKVGLSAGQKSAKLLALRVCHWATRCHFKVKGQLERNRNVSQSTQLTRQRWHIALKALVGHCERGAKLGFCDCHSCVVHFKVNARGLRLYGHTRPEMKQPWNDPVTLDAEGWSVGLKTQNDPISILKNSSGPIEHFKIGGQAQDSNLEASCWPTSNKIMQKQTLCIIHAVQGVHVGNNKLPISTEIQEKQIWNTINLFIYARDLNVMGACLFLFPYQPLWSIKMTRCFIYNKNNTRLFSLLDQFYYHC